MSPQGEMYMNRAKKSAAVPFAQAMKTMSAMLGTEQAHVTRARRENGIDLMFRFAAKQMFSLTISGEQVLSGKLALVQGREPTTSAMLVMHQETNLNTVQLFDGLVNGDLLDAEVVADNGFSLNNETVERWRIEVISDRFAHILDALMVLDVEPTENIGDRVESLRLLLAKSLLVQVAA